MLNVIITNEELIYKELNNKHEEITKTTILLKNTLDSILNKKLYYEYFILNKILDKNILRKK